MRNNTAKRRLLFAACLLFGSMSVAQTVAPPIAEYRGKAQGMFELRNDGDTPLAAILEVQSFSVDEDGTLRYEPLNSNIKVDLGQNSFVIPPHSNHYVFYRASTSAPQGWFTILNTLTKAASSTNSMRINFVLPHVVYFYQKQKLKKEDVAVVLETAGTGRYRVVVKNNSDKLGRIESITGRGFEKQVETGGFPIFPGKKRNIVVDGGSAKADTSVKVTFEDGFSVQVPLS